MKKADLQKKLEEALEDQRRIKRALNMALMDLKTRPQKELTFDNEIKPSNHSDYALKIALDEFNKNVTEPELDGDSSRITVYIKSSNGIGWSWEEDYKKNGQFSWCGAYAAFCYQKVKFSLRNKVFPSCYRMNEAWSNTSRRVKNIYVGDIVTVFTTAHKSYGDHIVIALSLVDDNGDFETIEGNAKGFGPNGDWREGVSKRTRNIKDVARIYRLLDGDFDE